MLFSPYIPSRYVAGMLLGIRVVVNADEQYVSIGSTRFYTVERAYVFGYLVGVVTILDLLYGLAGSLVALQLDDDGRLGDILARYQHKVSIPLASWQLSVEDIVTVGVVVGDGQYTGHGVLVAVTDDVVFS